jgi:glutamate dehydrogenase (NAD(P)+)
VSIPGARVALQGFGNVGSVAAELFAHHGALVVAVQDHTGTVFDPAGLDVQRLRTTVAREGGVAAYTGAASLHSEQFWEVDCDLLVPAALEGQITRARAAKLAARVVVEAANGPTTPEADLILADRGIIVVPDVIANAGGVTVSYFEWVQDFNSFFWSEDEINGRLDQILTRAFAHIWDTHVEHQVSLRTAAYIVACTRVLRARAERGLYP